MGRLKTLWTSIHTSLWFVPTLFVIGAIALAAGLVEVDADATWKLHEQFPRIFGLSANGARSLLSAIATSMITVAGVSFSITIVSLSLAATQYTSRTLRNFMRDRTNQLTLGGLIAVFVYCLGVLRTIRGGQDPFVPTIATLTGILIAIAAIGLFIYFLHHIASSIEASTILSGISAETVESLIDVFPPVEPNQPPDPDPNETCEALAHDRTWIPIPADSSGFIQTAEISRLLKCARRYGVIVRMEHAIGDFVVKDTPLVSVSGAKPDAKLVRSLNALFGIQSFRSIEQDPGFGIRQIVDMAVKALSPGINDPTTAVICVNYLGAILHTLAGRRVPSSYCRIEGELRVISRGPTFESLVNEMFAEIRQNARDSVPVLAAMFSTIQDIATSELPETRRKILLKQAGLIREHALEHITSAEDLKWMRA